MGLNSALCSPNGAMRRGWNGITISRDTIHIEGMELGYKRPVLFERHAVGGEYGAGWKELGAGKVTTTWVSAEGGEPVVVDDQLGKIMDEIWDNRHQYDPCKHVRGRLIAKSGNTMRVDIPTQLASLDELLAKCVIDEEEFSIAKAKVLNLPTNVP